MADQTPTTLDIEQIINDILSTIEREREREIIARRFGLFERKETLEQIGELLGITRERVRQLEKAVITRLKATAEQDLPHIKDVQARFISELEQLGNVSRVSDLSGKLTKDNSRIDQARVAFLTLLCPSLAVIDENDHFYHAVGLSKLHNEKQIKDQVAKIIEAIKKVGEPTSIDKVATAVKDSEEKHVAALASTSKQLATLNGRWGLVKWPMVNPKNIRDKIYVILYEKGKPLHSVYLPISETEAENYAKTARQKIKDFIFFKKYHLAITLLNLHQNLQASMVCRLNLRSTKFLYLYKVMLLAIKTLASNS